MIVLDKKQPVQKITVTISERASSIPSYHLHLKSSFTKEEHKIALGGNLSNYPVRYDAFQFQMPENEIQLGEYTYHITDANILLETGYARVIDTTITASDVIKNYEPDEEVKYFIYNPTG